MGVIRKGFAISSALKKMFDIMVMLLLLVLSVSYGAYAYVTDVHFSVIVASVGMLYLLWPRLTMSTSSQASSLNGHVSANASNKSASAFSNTTYHHNYYCGEEFLARQETVLEKQTVRITPPPYSDGPKSAVIVDKRKVNGYGNLRSATDYYSQTSSGSEIKNNPSLVYGCWCTNRSDRVSNRSLQSVLVDKECQTDEIRTAANMDDSAECSSYDVTSNTNEQISRTDEVDRYTKVSETDYYHSVEVVGRIESKDREIEHIDVIVNESRYTPDATDDVVLDLSAADEILDEGNGREIETAAEVDTEHKQNGFVAEPEIEVHKSENTKLTDEDKNKNRKEDDDDDSCCVNCLYVTLNVCDCVIL